VKVDRIQLLNSSNVVFCELGFRDPGSENPYIMKSITGLDAPEIVPRFYGLGLESRQKYYSFSVANRDVGLKIGLNPNAQIGEAFSDLRDELTRNIVSSRSGEVRMNFYYGSGPGSLQGYLIGFVTKIENALTQSPELIITLRCNNPTILGSLVELFDLEPDLAGTLVVTDDISTKPHNFNFTVAVTADSPYLSFKDESDYSNWSFTVAPGVIGLSSGFLNGDILTVKAQDRPDSRLRVVEIQRGSDIIPIAEKVQSGSFWPVIFPGENLFRLEGGSFEWSSIDYAPEFWGV